MGICSDCMSLGRVMLCIGSSLGHPTYVITRSQCFAMQCIIFMFVKTYQSEQQAESLSLFTLAAMSGFREQRKLVHMSTYDSFVSQTQLPFVITIVLWIKILFYPTPSYSRNQMSDRFISPLSRHYSKHSSTMNLSILKLPDPTNLTRFLNS